MITVRAHVRNGRLILDEPTDLPDGTEVELQGTEGNCDLDAAPPADQPLSLEEANELKAIRAQGFVTHEDVRAKLDARRR